MEKETYKMKFKCWNCEYTWEEEIEKGHLIGGGGFGSDGIYEEIDMWDGKWRYIVCPNCKTQKEVTKVINKEIKIELLKVEENEKSKVKGQFTNEPREKCKN